MTQWAWIPVGNHDYGDDENNDDRNHDCVCYCGGNPCRLSSFWKRVVGERGSFRRIVVFLIIPVVLIVGLAAGLSQSSSAHNRSIPVSIVEVPSPTPLPSEESNNDKDDADSSPPPTGIQDVLPTSTPTDWMGTAVVDDTGIVSTTVLNSGSWLTRNDFVSSPNGEVGLTPEGTLIFRDLASDSIVWQTTESGADQCHMQMDGNLVCRRENGTVAWQSFTSHHEGAHLIMNNVGQIAIVWHRTFLWLAGEPRVTHSDPLRESLSFPIRGIFYYPWYPETWTSNQHEQPYLGTYSSGDPQVQSAHINALTYAHIDVAIASWWGTDHHLDRARITNLMDKSKDSNVKWTIYHEPERVTNPSVEQLSDDLSYIRKWYVNNAAAWAIVDARPLIFVNNEGDCEVARRWNEASNREWFVVLKVFPGHEECSSLADSWHAYSPKNASVQDGDSFSISPGFWKANDMHPVLSRRTKLQWYLQTRNMVDSNSDWQLITTFNKWVDGSSIEPGRDRSSSSGYGYFLDALHEIF